MSAKQDFIKKAYGDNWEKLSMQIQNHALENNGWITWYVSNNDFIEDIQDEFPFVNKEDFDFIDHHPYDKRSMIDLRPKTLYGIEINHGWIKIESEEDLPKVSKSYRVINKQGMKYINNYQVDSDDFKKHWMSRISHYREIYVEPNPIF